jgi:hypothetical protein
MARNQLPEGVGKKIVEALKRQAEVDVTPVPVSDNTFVKEIPLSDLPDLDDIKPEALPENITSIENVIVEETPAVGTFNIQEEKPVVNPVPETIVPEKFTQEQTINETPTMTFNLNTGLNVNPNLNSTLDTNLSSLQSSETLRQNIVKPNVQITIPANVAVLKNLIASLPAGVTKQTGAQIIRQTLEAMGIPMNNVLKEAQEVQEELNSSTRECMMKIQEYKTNILQLEQSVQEYQKNITQINDLVSLFLLTDRK